MASKFEKELQALINVNSVENESDTPDFLLAMLVADTLKTYNKIVRARDDWYGFTPWGNKRSPNPTEKDTPKEEDKNGTN